MGNLLFQKLQAALEIGESVRLYTVLKGKRGGRDLTAQKFLQTAAGSVPSDPTLLENFWKPLLPLLETAACPAVIEQDGVCLLTEYLSSRQQLILCGGGHISQPLAQLGHLLEFDVTVIDDRPEFANSSRFPSAQKVLCQPFGQALRQIRFSNSSYFVVVTRGHQYDRTCVEQILPQPFAYLGMIGSKKKVRVVLEELQRQGFPQEQIQRIYAPIGLPIGGQTPAEIAVSIAAQLIQVRCGAAQGNLSPEGLALAAQGEPMVLATIVKKQGSAPRGVGAKMLVGADGTLYGTIGGGAAEAQAAAQAAQMFGGAAPSIQTFQMTGKDAQDAGMVCGGIITVLLDPLNSSHNSQC